MRRGCSIRTFILSKDRLVDLIKSKKVYEAKHCFILNEVLMAIYHSINIEQMYISLALTPIKLIYHLKTTSTTTITTSEHMPSTSLIA